MHSSSRTRITSTAIVAVTAPRNEHRASVTTHSSIGQRKLARPLKRIDDSAVARCVHARHSSSGAVMAAVFAFALLFAASAANAMDANHDGMDDGWQTRFNVAAFTGSLDPDGDGVPNLVEAINWTDPNDAASKPSSGWGYIVMFYRQFVLRPN